MIDCISGVSTSYNNNNAATSAQPNYPPTYVVIMLPCTCHPTSYAYIQVDHCVTPYPNIYTHLALTPSSLPRFLGKCLVYPAEFLFSASLTTRFQSVNHINRYSTNDTLPSPSVRHPQTKTSNTGEEKTHNNNPTVTPAQNPCSPQFSPKPRPNEMGSATM